MVTKNSVNKTLCVVGLGYVGLPLAEAFSKHIAVIGYDIDEKKINRLSQESKSKIEFTASPAKIKEADFVIICVPTPVHKSKEPDMTPVISAATTVGKNLKKGATIVLESTVYPGVMEEIVAPILEKESRMTCGKDFKIGYSPERINPGDNEHSIDRITKIVAGMDKETGENLSSLYSLVTKVYLAPNIKTAEAAKVIENIQRDLNIALMNELAMLFHRMGLDTREVLEAAGTKWNFHKYQPGMIGGHCIPVDPYYLVFKAKEMGYHTQVILAGRAINDYMPKYVAEMAIKGLNDQGKVINGSKILVMGLTYKENVPDVRESPAKEMIEELKEYKADVYGYDPLLTKEDIEKFHAKPVKELKGQKYDAIIITVKHRQFENMSITELQKITNGKPVLIDVRGFIEASGAEKEGFCYKRL